MNETSLLDQLQTLLLEDDRKSAQQIYSRVHRISSELNSLQSEISSVKAKVTTITDNIDDPNELVKKVDPLIEFKLAELKSNFHDIFGYEIQESVRSELNNSKDEFIESLYPALGKLVRRYVKYQFDIFLDTVSQRLENTFSWQWWLRWVKGKISGVSQQELAIQDAFGSKIEEIFIIHRNSGLLLGCDSRNNTTDVDMIASMLTAIKAFVQDAFRHSDTNNDLDTIEYGSYKIFIVDFHQYYTAAVISGVANAYFKDMFNKHITNFCERDMPKSIGEVDDKLFNGISQKLKASFKDFGTDK